MLLNLTTAKVNKMLKYNLILTSPSNVPAMVQSLIQRAQGAIDSGEYGQWRSRVANEIQQLNNECPERMQGQ